MDKVVFITGASQGLGREMALEFARRGYRVALSARREPVLNELRAEIQQFSKADVSVYPLDVSRVEEVQATLQQAYQDLGRLDIVVANAGMAREKHIGQGDFNSVKAMIDLNITGAFATIDSSVKIFKEQGFGHIVGLGSVAGERGMPGAACYSASKAALATYLEALRAENYQSSSIDITLLCPGYIDTPLNRDLAVRPFVIPAQKGGKLLVDKIIAKKNKAYVPSMPWSIVAPLLRHLPIRLLAKM